MSDTWYQGLGSPVHTIDANSHTTDLYKCSPRRWLFIDTFCKWNLSSRWVVDRQLQVVVPAKRTPWVIHSTKSPASWALLAPDRPTVDDTTLENIRAPVVKADVGVPVGKEPVVRRTIIPRTEKLQSTLKSSGRTSKPKQRRRRRESVQGRGT